MRDRGDASRVLSAYAGETTSILLAIENTSGSRDLDRVNDLQPLRGDRTESWSMWVLANRRITFRLCDGDVWGADLVEYR